MKLLVVVFFFSLSIVLSKKHKAGKRFNPVHKMDMKKIDDVKKTTIWDRDPRVLANENNVAV